MRVLFISNIPTPYRNDFYNELGKSVSLTVVYEAKGASNQGIRFNWDISQVKNYKAIFLKEGDIEEKKINPKIFAYLKEKWDCIFVTNYAYRTEMAAIIYLKCHHIPHCFEVDGGTISEEIAVKKLFKTFLISGAENYFAPSRQTDEYLIHYGAKENKIKRNPFSSLHTSQICTEKISHDQKIKLRRELGFENVNSNVIVGVGQLIYRKGWDSLIAIARELEGEIYIIGEGELRDEYEKNIRNQGIENIHLVGFLTNEMTTKYYQSADFFVLPTRYDVWGLVVNEALANGLPVITTNKCVAGNELIIDDENGYVIPADDPDRLLEAVNKLLSDKEKLYNMQDKALKSIANYTIENMAKVHVDFLSQYINRKNTNI